MKGPFTVLVVVPRIVLSTAVLSRVSFCSLVMALSLATACRGDIAPPAADPRVIWSVVVPNGAVRPAVDADHVYFGDLDHRIYAVDRASGKIAWTTQNNPIGGPGFQAGSGSAVAGPVVAIPDAYVFGLDRASGALRWQFHPPNTGFSWFPASDATTIYAGSGDGRVFAIDATTGTERWGVRVADDTGGAAFSPVVFRDTLYVGYLRRTIPRSGGVGALDAKTGAILWYTEFAQGAPNSASSSHGNVAIVNDVVIAASDGGEIYALRRATGAVEWLAPRVPILGMPVDDDRPVSVSGQIVLAGSSGGTVTGYAASTGAQLWQITLQGSVVYQFASDQARAFIVDLGGRIVALDAATGAIAWTFGGFMDTHGVMLSPPMLNGNVVYVGGEKASYALRAYDP